MEKSKDVVVTEKGSHLSNGVHLCNGNNKPGMTAETIVQIHSQVSRGCYFTRFQVICAVFAFLLTIAVAIVLVAFVKKENNIYVTRPSPVCSCDKSNGYNVTFAFTKDSKNVTVLYAENLTQVENKSASNVSSGEESVVSEKPKVQKDQPIVTQPYREIRLPRSLIPSFYDIELKIDLENDTFFGRVNMTLIAMNRTKFVIFHINMLRISRESIFVRNVKTREFIGIRKQFRVWSNQFYVLELVKEVTVGETYIVEVNSFLGFINKDLKGLYLSTYTTPEGETRKLAATQLQSTDARKMFPCLDEPDMKARFAVTIIHQDKYTALSNMPPMTEQFIPPIWLKVKYHVTPIMSTYLLAIIVSDFKYQERNLTGDYRLKVWAQPNKINQTDYAMDMAEKCYLFFLDYFNISDVVPKSDHVAVPDFSGGAMENWGLVIYRETALLYDPDVSSGENQLMVTLIVAHEVAHTWFGNMVTMKWWDDLWLNEGFASLLMYFAMDHIFPEWNVFTLHVVVREVFQVMVNDALVTSHPVSAPIIHPDDIAEYFDMISYSKGMAILRMLMNFIGWEDFKNGLRLYVRKYKFQNAEMEDLWETFSEAVNYEIDVKSIMNTWTKQMGYPVVTMRTEGDYYLLEQERFLLDANSSSANDSIYGYKWRIPFTYIVESNPDVESKSLVWLNMTSAYIPREPNTWILGNVDYTGFYRINYELSMWGQLADQLNKDHKVFPEANRAGLIGDSFNLARAQILEYDVALNMTTYLKREDRYVPWKAFLSSLEFIKGSLSKSGAYVLLQKYLHDLVAPVFDRVGVYDKDGILPDSYLRQLILVTACDVGVKKAVQYAKDTFRKWKDHGIPVPKDYASVIYSVGVREGSVEEWDFVWNKTQETNVANEREMLMEALGQSQKPWLLWRYANWIFDPTKIRMQDVRLVVSFFTKNSLGRMIALHLLMNKWNRLNRQFGSDNFLIRETISDVTQYVNTNFEYKQLRTLFRNNPPKNARKETENALELIRANIKWMKDNYEIIADWLRQHTVGML